MLYFWLISQPQIGWLQGSTDSHYNKIIEQIWKFVKALAIFRLKLFVEMGSGTRPARPRRKTLV
ncbi:MAG: hypothetical protein EWV82_02715 [Microcystis aeruginosa Ma_AC_P_19900807_S299]|nr:MAG: hypothetical protein EWV82_02715 [Microcystis aeruginosa Ma_AC_P_19900807_S299]